VRRRRRVQSLLRTGPRPPDAADPRPSIRNRRIPAGLVVARRVSGVARRFAGARCGRRRRHVGRLRASRRVHLRGRLYGLAQASLGLQHRVGGLAGSFAVLAGAAAVDATPQFVPTVLALALFLWTPPHFWSLAAARGDDYRSAGVPMLPLVTPVPV